jgi:hypothetical protein
MNNSAMTNANIVANGGGCLLIGAMDDSAILYIDLIAHSNLMDIAANNSLKPNTALVAHDHITNNGRVFCDIAIVSHLGRFSFNG